MVPPWIWTPSWSHCTSSWTTGGSSIALGGHRSPVGPPCSAIRRSLPWPSSPSGPLQKREGLLAFRFFAPALLLPSLCSQSQLNRRIRALEPQMRLLQRNFARELAEPSAVYRVMDTTLVPAIVRVRASEASKGLFCAQASFGRTASKTE